MSTTAQQDVTRHLTRLQGGDRAAAEDLFPLVYGELRALAQFENALAATVRVRGAPDQQVAFIRQQMGDIYYTLNQDEPAESCYRAALAIFRQGPAPASSAVA